MSDKEIEMDDTLTPEQLEEGRRRFANIGRRFGAALFDTWLSENFAALLTTAERAVAERDALRADVLEEAAAVCDKRAVTLNDMSNAQGDHPNRFKINTAWHETVDLAATIRAMKAAK